MLLDQLYSYTPAMNALEAKRVQLGLPSHTPDAITAPTLADDGDTKSVSVIINNHNGLHVRPASKLVAALAGFNEAGIQL